MLVALIALLGCPHPPSPAPAVEAPSAAPRWEPPPPPEPSHVGGWHLFQAHRLDGEVLVHVDLLGEDVHDLVRSGVDAGREPRGAPAAAEAGPADHELARRLIHGYLGGTDLVDLWGGAGLWARGVPATVQRVELAEAPAGRVGVRVWLRPVDARNPALEGVGWGITRLGGDGPPPTMAEGALDPECARTPPLAVEGIEGRSACWHAPLEPGVQLAATLWTSPGSACTVLAYAHDDGEREMLAPLCRMPAMVPVAWTTVSEEWFVVLQDRSWRALSPLPAAGEALEPRAWSRRPRR